MTPEEERIIVEALKTHLITCWLNLADRSVQVELNDDGDVEYNGKEIVMEAHPYNQFIFTLSVLEDTPSPETDIMGICFAYEQGFGKGLDNRDVKNPYCEGGDGWKAWQYGYTTGFDKRQPSGV